MVRHELTACSLNNEITMNWNCWKSKLAASWLIPVMLLRSNLYKSWVMGSNVILLLLEFSACRGLCYKRDVTGSFLMLWGFSAMGISYLEGSCLVHWKFRALPFQPLERITAKRGDDNRVRKLFVSRSQIQTLPRIPSSGTIADRR